MRKNRATLAVYFLSVACLAMGCGSQLTPEQKSVKAEIETAHKGEAVTFMLWNQSTSADVNVKEYFAAKFAQMRAPLDADIREIRDMKTKPRDESLAHRETVRGAWKQDDERIATRDEWRAGLKLKWKTQDRDWEAADKAGQPKSPTRAAELQERIKDQQALARWKPDEDAEQAARVVKQSKLEDQWKTEDEEWEKGKKAIDDAIDDQDRKLDTMYDRLVTDVPEMTFVRVKYRAPNRVGQNELADDIFGIKESKVVRIADKELVAWLLPRMDKSN